MTDMIEHSPTLHVGDVAKAAGVGVQTLHYYEREGLLPSPERSASGYRLYPEQAVERVRFIRKAQALGLPLKEIKEILELAEQGSSPCGRVQASLARKLQEVDHRLRELRTFRSELASLIEQAPRLRGTAAQSRVCAIVEESAISHTMPNADRPLRLERRQGR